MKRRYTTKIILIIFLLSFVITISESSLFAWSGKILDKETSKPLESAVIIRSWDREYATPGGRASSLVAFEEILSDKDGNLDLYLVEVPN